MAVSLPWCLSPAWAVLPGRPAQTLEVTAGLRLPIQVEEPTCVATQPPQQVPILGPPAVHTAVLRGREQRLAIRGEGGEVDLEQSTDVVPSQGKKHLLFIRTPGPSLHCPPSPRSLGLEPPLQASLCSRSPDPGATLHSEPGARSSPWSLKLNLTAASGRRLL